MDIPFPALNQEDPHAEGVLATWYVDDGQQVSENQLLGDAQVDKVDAEIAAPQAGTVRLLVFEGDAVHQGTAVARIDD